MSYLGDNLKVVRNAWGLTQSELGYLVGASRGMIMQYENRGTQPKLKVLREIIRVTGLSKDILQNTKLGTEDVAPLRPADQILLDNINDNPDDYNETDDTDDLLGTDDTQNDNQFVSHDEGKYEQLVSAVEDLNRKVIDLEATLYTAKITIKTLEKEKVEVSERLQKEKDEEKRRLENDKEDLRVDRNHWRDQFLNLQAQVKQQSKKRDPQMEDGGSTVSTGGEKP